MSFVTLRWKHFFFIVSQFSSPSSSIVHFWICSAMAVLLVIVSIRVRIVVLMMIVQSCRDGRLSIHTSTIVWKLFYFKFFLYSKKDSILEKKDFCVKIKVSRILFSVESFRWCVELFGELLPCGVTMWKILLYGLKIWWILRYELIMCTEVNVYTNNVENVCVFRNNDKNVTL